MRTELVNARGKRTQVQVANDTGLSQKHISKLELGKVTPSLKTAFILSRYYKSSIDKLFPDVCQTPKTHVGST